MGIFVVPAEVPDNHGEVKTG
ncbi:unnamed protein product [Nezara viridula]|uniref:Uncharacterized protein n=1 Tax=Nezara viridula TaxID=85310 RepID=A0A9P0ED89_NEZVI|nr:unnamed protein product [Nezara viridula]